MVVSSQRLESFIELSSYHLSDCQASRLTSSIPPSNLGRFDYISEFQFDLFIRLVVVRETQRAIFNIVNFSKTKSLYRDGMSPVMKSTSWPKWQRLPAKNVYYYHCPNHHRNYVMFFAFCFDREDDVYQFS
ncbi:cytosolic carboxypeptidase 6-like [Carassius carassius]|uniref:cytosolic carboxypeptidase 6-like n=1 Tax=Carassius carassius TaxID=217509 RepID=UPI0028689FAA|nr:cytosolic carboxypeptidase 6-like [Carassius carassius]